MKKTTLILISFLFSLPMLGQTYEWVWAKRGGGNNSTGSQANQPYEYENVLDIAVDGNNDYYFTGSYADGNSNYEGEPMSFVGNAGVSNDTYLISTDCEGNFRWKKEIGGRYDDYARSVKVNPVTGNIILAGTAFGHDGPLSPPKRFDTDSIVDNNLSSTDPGVHNKAPYLIEYTPSGNFVQLYEPEKNDIVRAESGFGIDMAIDSQGNIHWLLGLAPGTHFNGNVTLPDNGSFYVLVAKLDANLNYISHLILPYEGPQNSGYRVFLSWMEYDENLDRYYVLFNQSNSSNPIFYDNVTYQKPSILAAIDAGTGNTEWVLNQQGGGGVYIYDFHLVNGNIALVGDCANYGVDTPPLPSLAGFVFEQGDVNNGGNGELVPYTMLIDSNADLLWGSYPDNYQNAYPIVTSTPDGHIVTGVGMDTTDTWDGYTPPYGGNNGLDPTTLIFDASSGNITQLYQIEGSSASAVDEATAITTDNYGNIIMGGYMHSDLFANHPTIGPLVRNGNSQPDFWFAKLAITDCEGDLLDVEGPERKASIKAYPNPAGQQLFFDGLNGSYTYALYDVQGRLVKQGRLGEQNNAIDVGSLTQGLYLVKLSSGGVEQVVRFVKE